MFKQKTALPGVKIRPICNGLVKRIVRRAGFKYVGSVRVCDEEIISAMESEISANGYLLVEVGELYFCPVFSDAGCNFSDCDVFL